MTPSQDTPGAAQNAAAPATTHVCSARPCMTFQTPSYPALRLRRSLARGRSYTAGLLLTEADEVP